MVWEKLEEFREGVTGDGKHEWKFEEGCQIMRVNPDWFIDERTLELVRTYLFYRPNPSQAFQGRIGEQPGIWIEAKIVLDCVIGLGTL